MTNQKVIVENVACGYGIKNIIENISFSLREGEFVGMLGPNGSGKTTLIRAITKILPLRQGNITIMDRFLTHYHRHDLARIISVVSQSNLIAFANITIEQCVSMGRIPHLGSMQFSLSSRDRKAIRDAMGVTDILHLKEKRLDAISGGELQRVYIARAIAQEPRILLLDEPTIHLDIRHTLGILGIIKKLTKEHSMTVLSVLHDLNAASAFCDRVIMLKEGTIEEIGAPQEVINSDNLKKIYDVDLSVYTGELSNYPQILF